MKNYQFLVTLNDATSCVHAVLEGTQTAALAVLVKQLTISSGSDVRSIDFIEPGATAELVKARKSKKRPSRADRFSEAQGKVSDAKAELEELRDELQNWLDSMPESLQGGDKASQLEEAISELDDAVNSCDEIEGKDVSFPGMFG